MKINWLTLFFAAITLGIGYYLNKLANERNNAILLEQLKAELESLKNQPQTSRVADQQKQIEAQISLLQLIS